MTSNKVQALPVSELDWGLLPLLKWLKLIGVLAPSSGGNCIYFSGFIYRCICWLFTLFIHGLILFYSLNSFLNSTTNRNATFAWVEIINYVSKVAHNVGIHTIVFFLLIGRWDQLKETLNRTENRLGLKRIDYGTFCNICLVSVIYIIVFVSINLSYIIRNHLYLTNFFNVIEGWLFGFA